MPVMLHISNLWWYHFFSITKWCPKCSE